MRTYRGRLSFLARERAQDGSMLLALLGSIMAMSIITTVALAMLSSAGTTRHNQNYTLALQVADAGIQDAIFRANNGQPVTGGSGTVGQGTYTWTATQTATGWKVTSFGTERTLTRTVEVEVTKAPRFFLAAFGDRGIELKGSNGADSYNSANGTTRTGNGNLGSNDDVNMNGNSTTVDNVTLYNHTDSANTCTNNGGSGCQHTSIVGPKLDLASDENMAFITDQLAACSAAYGALPNWRSSTAATPGVLPYNGGIPYCFETVTFDRNTVLSGADAAHPVVIYVRGAVSIEHGINVNCSGCSPSSTPVASTLQIYSAGSTDTQSISIGNQSTISAAIYAPRASCLGNPSAAQADIFGALVCGAIGRITSGNQGGWSFHFDDALKNIGTGGYQVVRYDEH
ncbi:MAG TPA: hypothetical protein VGX28_06215 [Frankiaceae bacterium]|jgi:hypothetical protein|nr:hypothetical protein [Frankiaceae bacterium]